MMPGGEPPRANDVLRGGMPVGATISGGAPVNEAPRDHGLGLNLRVLGDSTSSPEISAELATSFPTLPFSTESPGRRGFRQAVASVSAPSSFGVPGLGIRVFHDGFGSLGHRNTYTDLGRDYLSMSAAAP
jgi:hypothetical protein